MNESLIRINDEHFNIMLNDLRQCSKDVSQFINGFQPLLNGERYLTDKEISLKLKVSRRTLQDYRNNKIIPYIMFGGKVLYRESDVQKILEENYFKALK